MTETTLWKCDSCGVEVIRDEETHERHYERPFDAPCRYWYVSHPFVDNREGAPVQPAHCFSDKLAVCEYCLKECWHCGRPIAPFAEGLDTYDPGAAFPWDPDVPWKGKWVCVDCEERRCADCKKIGEDCECNLTDRPSF